GILGDTRRRSSWSSFGTSAPEFTDAVIPFSSDFVWLGCGQQQEPVAHAGDAASVEGVGDVIGHLGRPRSVADLLIEPFTDIGFQLADEVLEGHDASDFLVDALGISSVELFE